MLKKETVEALAKALKLEASALEAAIKDEKEVDLTVPDGLVYTEAELKTLKENTYTQGKNAGVEMAVNEAKKKHELDFQGRTLDGLITAIQRKAVEDAGINPDKKVTELEGKLKTVQQTAAELQNKLQAAEQTAASARLDSELLKHIPAGTLLEPADILALMKTNGYQFENNNGAVHVLKDGSKLEDTLAKPLPVKDVIAGFVKDKKLITESGGGGTPPGGRGGGGGTPLNKFTKLSELKAHFTEQGKNLNGKEFNDAVMKARADFKEFDMSA